MINRYPRFDSETDRLKWIGGRLRKARIERGLSQTSLAKTLGLSKQLVSAWEKGRSEIRVTTLMKLSELLGTSVADVLSSRRRRT